MQHWYPYASRTSWFATAVIVLLALASGCDPGDGRRAAAALAVTAGWERVEVEGRVFVLHGWLKRGTADRLHVYIEGDGRAFVNPWTPSSDPTPLNPMGLKLALADPAPSVLYLGRPCQYVTPDSWRNCTFEYWTTARYAPEVVEDMNTALDRGKALARAKCLALAGFSGGGGLAVLLAARRDDVDAIVTVAGNLDHTTWTTWHALTPLKGSLNPADAAMAVADIAQTHFVGQADKVMPASVAQAYRKRLPEATPCRIVPVPGAGHDFPWERVWPALLQQHAPDSWNRTGEGCHGD